MNQKARKFIYALLIVSLLTQSIFMPDYVHAQQLSEIPPGSYLVVENGERFMNAAPLAMEGALELSQLLEDINQNNLETVPPETLAEARHFALQTAQQTAVAQGALGGILYGLDQLAVSGKEAVDLDVLFTDVAANGFSEELETTLLDTGLTITEVSTLESGAVDNFIARREVAQNGFVTDTVAYLQSLGLSDTTITEVEQTYATYGVSDNTASDKLAQLRGSQDELTLARDSALVTYIQLLSQQVFQAQLNGETGRPIASADIDTLAEDQLRLLTHIGYLNALWGGEANPDVGEGQWLFIERYSWRVAERLDALILETHNLGLTVDLFIALQIHATALAAQAGGPVQAKSELDKLAEIEASLVGDNLPGGQVALQATPSFFWRVAVAIYDNTGNDGLLNLVSQEELPVTETAVTVAADEAYGRVIRLGKPAQTPALSGDLNESDETNNTDLALFYTTPANLPPDIISFIEEFIPGFSDILDFAWGVLTGQSDNPLAIGINIILSFSPVLGIVLDAIALIVANNEWERAFAFIGMIVSILSDGAEVLAAISAAVPPALAATVPGAILIEALDVGAAVLKGVRAFVSSQAWNLIKTLRFDKALKVGGEALFRLARYAYKQVDEWPHSFTGILNLLQASADEVAGAFGRLTARFGNNLDEFTDGAFLAGRAIKAAEEAGVELSDDAVQALQRYGDEVLGEAVDDLSPETVGGLAHLMDEVPEDEVRRFIDAFPCSVVTDRPLVDKSHLSSFFLPRNDTNDPLKCAQDFITNLGRNLNNDQANGVRTVFQVYAKGDEAASFIGKYAPNIQDEILTFVGKSKISNWQRNSLTGLGDMINNIGLPNVNNIARRYSDEVMEGTFRAIRETSARWTSDGLEGVAKIVNRFDEDLASDILTRMSRGELGNTVFTWLGNVDDEAARLIANNPNQSILYDRWVRELSTRSNTSVGTIFELKMANDELINQGIRTIADYPTGDKLLGIDFIMNDGRHLELKNWNSYPSRTNSQYQDALNQFRNNLGIDADGAITGAGRYGDQHYEYVFRGNYNQNILDGLCETLIQAHFAGRISAANFNNFNVKFLGIGDVFTNATAATNLSSVTPHRCSLP